MHQIVIQHATDKALVPKPSLLRAWAKKALTKKLKSAEITLRIVDAKEMSELNASFRNKKGPTNVLSFPFQTHAAVTMEVPILGDIIICAEVVNREAEEQKKSKEAHWAHMVIHGVFHLLGYDHETESDAKVMESLEKKLMQELGFPNPYHTGDKIKNYD